MRVSSAAKGRGGVAAVAAALEQLVAAAAVVTLPTQKGNLHI